jgi:Protein of unknown function (DUF2510)
MNTPQPGWYDDPEDSRGQRYWDGGNWTPNRRRNPISQPPPPHGLPAQSAPPPPYQQSPSPLPGGGPPKKSRTPTVIAAVIGAVAVLAVIGWLASPSEKGNQGSPNTSNQGSTDTGNQGSNSGHTKSYNVGYWWAYTNKSLYINFGDYNPLPDFCARMAKGEAPVQGLNSAEWIQGCIDSFHKMGTY